MTRNHFFGFMKAATKFNFFLNGRLNVLIDIVQFAIKCTTIVIDFN